MDTRAYGMLRNTDVSILELDQGPTQDLKREALESAGIESDHVTFVSVDFERSNWPEALMATSYKPKAKTLFIWEGVTLYLSASDISLTLRLLGSHSGAGSVVIADFFSRRFLATIKRSGRRILRETGEDLRFGLDLSGQQDLALKAFLTSCGVDAGEYQLLGSRHPKGASWPLPR